MSECCGCESLSERLADMTGQRDEEREESAHLRQTNKTFRKILERAKFALKIGSTPYNMIEDALD